MKEVNVTDNVKVLTEPGLEKLFGILREEIKNNVYEGNGSELEIRLKEKEGIIPSFSLINHYPASQLLTSF